MQRGWQEVGLVGGGDLVAQAGQRTQGVLAGSVHQRVRSELQPGSGWSEHHGHQAGGHHAGQRAPVQCRTRQGGHREVDHDHHSGQRSVDDSAAQDRLDAEQPMAQHTDRDHHRHRVDADRQGGFGDVEVGGSQERSGDTDEPGELLAFGRLGAHQAHDSAHPDGDR
ncbi:hypothetical protein [Streptomyces sp. GESEQ-35]|uniref:hypothetical protein n=1 Tax=Streptomyces sp. GESEQ-35 TaxID=2812657 RepID=UPI001B32F60D|nr:hypothetical protein [Streptomyces sp. GESEQ-35]